MGCFAMAAADGRHMVAAAWGQMDDIIASKNSRSVIKDYSPRMRVGRATHTARHACPCAWV